MQAGVSTTRHDTTRHKLPLGCVGTAHALHAPRSLRNGPKDVVDAAHNHPRLRWVAE